MPFQIFPLTSSPFGLWLMFQGGSYMTVSLISLAAPQFWEAVLGGVTFTDGEWDVCVAIGCTLTVMAFYFTTMACDEFVKREILPRMYNQYIIECYSQGVLQFLILTNIFRIFILPIILLPVFFAQAKCTITRVFIAVFLICDFIFAVTGQIIFHRYHGEKKNNKEELNQA